MDKRTEIEKLFDEDPAQMPMRDPSEREPIKAEEIIQPKKNHDERRYDRLFNKLQETEERLSEAERFKQELESGRFSSQQQSQVPEYFKKMYEPNLTLEERWSNFNESQKERDAKLIEQAQDRILKAQREEKANQDKWEDFIDQKLETLEEKHGVDFTSGSTKAERMKKDFLAIVLELSKDEDGNVEHYASFDKSYELWSKSKGQTDNTTQKKNISNLSSQNSAPAPTDQQEEGEGGMWGWMRHMK